MRYHEPHPIAGIIGVVTALCVAAASANAQSSSVPTGRFSGVDRKPHNEQGRVSSDGAAKSGAPHVADPYSLRMVAGGLGQCQAAVGSGRDGFDTLVYVVRQSTNEVVKLDPSGRVNSFGDLSPVASGGACSWPVFDFFGNYGGSLYVQDPTVRTANMDPAGRATVFAINEPADAVGTMEFDRTGAFGGSLFLSDRANGTIYTVNPGGEMDLFATGVGAGRSIAISDGAAGHAMFIADPSTSRVLMVMPGHPMGSPAFTFAQLGYSTPGFEPHALEHSKYGPFGRGVLIAADARTGRIIQLDSQGRRIAELGSGFKNLVSIEIAWSGVFAGRMIVTANGAVYAITPKCIADWNGDHSLTTSDISDFMVDFTAGDADFNGDGITSPDDLVSYYAAFSAGCP